MKTKTMFDRYKDLPLPLKASVWFFVCTFLQKGISVLTTPIFTRMLSSEEYGIFNIYMSWSDILSIFITFGLSSGVYQKKIVQINNPDERNRFSASLQGLATTTTGVSLIVYLLIQQWFNAVIGLSTELVLTIYIRNLFATAFGFWSMRQRIQFRYKALVLITLIVCFIKPVFGIISILLFPQAKVIARIYSLVFVEVIAYSWMYITQFKDGKKYYDKEYWKYAMGFVLPLIPHFLSQRILSQSDKIMIDRFVGASEAGIYSLAHSIGWVMTMVITALDYTLAPWTYQKLQEKNVKRLKSFSVVPVILMAVICYLFIACAPEVVSLFAPKEYYEASWLIPPLIISTYYMMVYTLFIYIEYFYEKTKYIMIATIISAVLNILLNYVFINLLGYQAAAYTSLVCYILYALFHYCIYMSICKGEYREAIYNNNKIALISLVFTGGSLLTMFLYKYLYVRIIIIVLIVCGFVYKRKQIKGYINELVKKKAPE